MHWKDEVGLATCEGQMLLEVTEINLLTGTRDLEDSAKDSKTHIRGPSKNKLCISEPHFLVTLSLYPGHFILHRV